MHVPLAAVPVAAGGTGVWLFSYNRENFQFDAGQRFGRFMTSRNMAIAQMGQYREDCHGMTEMTSAKMDTWQVVNTLFLCVCAALSCAGRIGMHGCAPPGWMCALYSGNIFVSIMFNGISLWMDMHGSLRAQCAMVHLLTRKTRLPIPCLAQLDQARMFGSSYEKQKVTDVFRVPFMAHPHEEPTLPDVDDGATDAKECAVRGEKLKKKSTHKHVGDPNKEFASTERDTIPSWIRDEQLVDKAQCASGGASGGGSILDLESTDIPQHFRLFSQAQTEWYGYDVYARVTMLYGVVHYLYALSYYAIGTTLSELRGYWISWAMAVLFMSAQCLIMRMDILQGDGNSLLPRLEYFGHLAPFLAILGGTMEFRFYWSNATYVTGWVFVVACFISHLAMACRQLDLAWPMTRDEDMPEEPTKQWWPKEWAIPTSFTKALWVLAPPKKLEEGQQDLMNESLVMKRYGGGVTPRRRKGGGGGSADKYKEGNKRVSTSDLHTTCTRIDQVFHQWFEDGIWPQLPRDIQESLHGQFKGYQQVRQRVDDALTPNGKSDSDGKLGMAKSLMEIEDELDKLESRFKNQGTAATKTEAPQALPMPWADQTRSEDLAWQVTRIAIVANIVCWIYMIIVSGVECALGPRPLLKPPGEPPWIRDIKLRTWMPGDRLHLSTDKIPDDYSLFAASIARWHGDASDIPFPPPEEHSEHGQSEHEQSESYGSGGGHRRLVEAYGNHPDAVMHDLAKLMPSIGRLVDMVEKENTTQVQRTPGLPGPTALAPTFMSPTAHVSSIEWPKLFEPRHLACGSKSSVVLTSRGAGAMVPRAAAEETVTATPFSLDGTLGHGPLAGAAMTSAGLQLFTKSGTMLTCPGEGPTAGVWRCNPANGAASPAASGSRLSSAAYSESPDGLSVTVALMFEDIPFTVSVFSRAHDDTHGWTPQRTVHVPPTLGELAGMTIANDELFVTSRAGHVHRQHLSRGTIAAHRPPTMPEAREFHASCPSHDEKIMHLAARQPGAGFAWVPELLTTA